MNQSIEQVRAIIEQFKYAQNPQAFLSQVLQNNPMVATLLQNGNNLEIMAKKMAAEKNIDLNKLIKYLTNT